MKKLSRFLTLEYLLKRSLSVFNMGLSHSIVIIVSVFHSMMNFLMKGPISVFRMYILSAVLGPRKGLDMFYEYSRC